MNRVVNFESWKRPSDAMCSQHVAMLSLAEWIVRNIPYSFDFAIDHQVELATRPLDDILLELSRMKYGRMCGGMSVLMARIAKREGYNAVDLNFGSLGNGETHVVVLVGEPDSDRIIYDPTFGCFSGNVEGNPVSIGTILDLLKCGRGSELRWVKFEPRERKFLFGDNPTNAIPLNSAITKLSGHRNVGMVDLDLFAALSWGAIWRRTRAQRPETWHLFNCRCFPLSTSGEADAEEIADRLRELRWQDSL
jgi:hypothetical protein